MDLILYTQIIKTSVQLVLFLQGAWIRGDNLWLNFAVSSAWSCSNALKKPRKGNNVGIGLCIARSSEWLELIQVGLVPRSMTESEIGSTVIFTWFYLLILAPRNLSIICILPQACHRIPGNSTHLHLCSFVLAGLTLAVDPRLIPSIS